jgi:hypothetical protein
LEDQHINSGASHFVPASKPIYATDGQFNAAFAEDQALALNSTHEQPYIVGTMACNTGPNGHDAGNFQSNQGVDSGYVIPFMVEQNTQASTPELPSFGGNKTPNYAVAYDQYNGGESDKAFSVTSGTGTASHNIISSEPVGFIHPRQLRGSETSNQVGIKPDADISDALTREGPGAVSYHIQDQNTGKSIKAKISDVSTCLGTRDLSKYQGTFNADVIRSKMQVRRLTPMECARLQGVPDNYLNIMFRGKLLADGLKYKLLGNGFAVPVVKYIGTRIQLVEDLINGIS